MADIEQVDATQGAGEPLYKGFAKVNEIITKINAIEAGATQDQTEAEIKALLAAEIAKLVGIEANAKDDQTANEIVILLEALAGDDQLSLAKLKDTAAYKKLTAARQTAIDNFLSNYFVDGIRKLGGDLDANNHSINNLLGIGATPISAAQWAILGASTTDSIIKGWIQFDGTEEIAIQDSFNVLSIGDNAAGSYTINWDTDFANDDYVCVVTTGSTGRTIDSTQNIAVGSIGIRNYDEGAAAYKDCDLICVIAIGDQ